MQKHTKPEEQEEQEEQVQQSQATVTTPNRKQARACACALRTMLIARRPQSNLLISHAAYLSPHTGQDSTTWTVEAFATSLGLATAVSKALLDGTSMPPGGEFELVLSLANCATEIEEKLRAGGLVERIAAALSMGAEKLKSAGAATAAELNKKFTDDGDAFKGEMGFGGTAEFYGGACYPPPSKLTLVQIPSPLEPPVPKSAYLPM